MSKADAITVGEVLTAYRQYQQTQQASLGRLQSLLTKLDRALSPEELQSSLAGGHLNGVPTKGPMLTALTPEEAILDMLKLIALVRPDQVAALLTPAVAAAQIEVPTLAVTSPIAEYRPASRRLNAISTDHDAVALERFERTVRQQILDGQYETTEHFVERLAERDITLEQVLHVIATGTAVNTTAEGAPTGKGSGLRVSAYVGERKLSVGITLDPPVLRTAYWNDRGENFKPLRPAEARKQLVHVFAVTPTEVGFRFDGNRRYRTMYTETDYSSRVEAGKSYLVETIKEDGHYSWRSIEEHHGTEPETPPLEPASEASQAPEPAPAEQ